MKKLVLSLMAIAAFTFSNAQKTSSDYIIKTKKLSTLETALTTADLMSTLQSAGPFTVFAPTNDAFNMLSPGVLGNLLTKENHDKLATLLKYHVVSGLWTTKAIAKAVEQGGGKAELRTVNGKTITAIMVGKKLKLTDETGTSTYINHSNKKTSNGYIHTINGVLMPN
ncbi:MAG: fasciclin domain-containing protein [Sphingobacteriales bacterium JAD_PAG50586_3]|nr:MAG: fasciclin domain-containing protein [Sphingobacteriales bacterium JAD_PAG50586_3]